MKSNEIGDTDFLKQVSIGVIGKMVAIIVGFIGSIVLARIIGPSGYGIFYLSLSISYFIQNPLRGCAAACKKRLTETDFNSGEGIGLMFLAIFILGIVGVIITYITLDFITQNSLIPLIVPILFFPNSLYISLKVLLSGRSNFSLAMWSTVVRDVLKVIGQIVLVVIGFGVWGMVGGMIIGSLLTSPLIYRWIGIHPKIPSMKSIRSVANFAKWSIPQGLLGTGLSRIDILLLGWLASASVAGKYQIAFNLSVPAFLFAGVIGQGLMGRISNLESRNSTWDNDLREALSYISIPAVPIFFGSLVLSEPLVTTIYGDEYAGSGGFLIGIALYRLLETQTRPKSAAIDGLNHPKINFKISLSELILNIVFGVLFWYLYGPIGVVVATVFTQSIAYIARTVFVQRITGTYFIFTLPFLKQFFTGIIMAIIIIVGKTLIGVDYWYEVLVLINLGVIIYVLSLFIIIKQFRITVRKILNHVKK